MQFVHYEQLPVIGDAIQRTSFAFCQGTSHAGRQYDTPCSSLYAFLSGARCAQHRSYTHTCTAHARTVFFRRSRSIQMIGSAPFFPNALRTCKSVNEMMELHRECVCVCVSRCACCRGACDLCAQRLRPAAVDAACRVWVRPSKTEGGVGMRGLLQ